MVWMRAQCNQGGKGVEGKWRAEFIVNMRFPSPETVKDDPEILTKPVWLSSTNAQKERNKQLLMCHMWIRTLGECGYGWHKTTCPHLWHQVFRISTLAKVVRVIFQNECLSMSLSSDPKLICWLTAIPWGWRPISCIARPRWAQAIWPSSLLTCLYVRYTLNNLHLLFSKFRWCPSQLCHNSFLFFVQPKWQLYRGYLSQRSTVWTCFSEQALLFLIMLRAMVAEIILLVCC